MLGKRKSLLGCRVGCNYTPSTATSPYEEVGRNALHLLNRRAESRDAATQR